jgi:hypothetical protein
MRYGIEFTGGTAGAGASSPDAGRDGARRAGRRRVPEAEITAFGSDVEYTVRAQERSSVEEQAAGAEGVATRIEAALAAYAPGGTASSAPRPSARASAAS